MKAMGALLMSLVLWACSTERPQWSGDYSEVEVPLDQLSSDEARARGRAIYREKCALCHGIRADGKGVRREALSGKPINFRSRDWRASTSPLDVYKVLSEGKRGTSMPAWPTLSETQKWEVAAYVLSVSEDGP